MRRQKCHPDTSTGSGDPGLVNLGLLSLLLLHCDPVTMCLLSHNNKNSQEITTVHQENTQIDILVIYYF